MRYAGCEREGKNDLSDFAAPMGGSSTNLQAKKVKALRDAPPPAGGSAEGMRVEPPAVISLRKRMDQVPYRRRAGWFRVRDWRCLRSAWRLLSSTCKGMWAAFIVAQRSPAVKRVAFDPNVDKQVGAVVERHLDDVGIERNGVERSSLAVHQHPA